MAFSSNMGSLSASPNVTPLIDVLLVLLIIFMVIAPNHSVGLSGQLPAPAAPAHNAGPLPLLVRVTAPHRTGDPAGYQLNGQLVSLAELESRLQVAKSLSADGVAWIQGDAAVNYQAVVTAVAAARHAGFQQIGLMPRDHQSVAARP